MSQFSIELDTFESQIRSAFKPKFEVWVRERVAEGWSEKRLRQWEKGFYDTFRQYFLEGYLESIGNGPRA